MSEHDAKRMTKARLLAENEELRLRLEEAEQTLEAIRHGEVDALVVVGPPGERIYTLSGAEHVYRVIVETMNEAALMVDADGTILFANQRFCDLMTVPMGDVVGRKVTAFAARPQQPPLRAFLEDAQAGPLQRHLTLRAADDTTVPVQLSASLLQTDESRNICLVATDLTELEASANSIRVLREHQQALEESESRFRAIFESSQDAVLIADNEGIYVQANPAVENVLGLTPEEVIGWHVRDFLSEQADFPGLWEVLLATGRLRGEMGLTRADGQRREAEAYAVAGILPGRHLLVIRDITERKRAEKALLNANTQLQIQAEELQTQAEELRVQTDELRQANEELSAREEELRVTNEALRESESRYRELVQNANSAIIRWKTDGTITFFNEYAQAFFGYTEDETVGRSVGLLVPQRDSTGTDMTRLVNDIAAHPEHYTNYINENICRDGRRVWMNWTNKPIVDASGRVVEVLAVGTDITGLKRAEDALRDLTKTLEARVAERTAQLKHRARQLQRLTLELSEAEDRERRHLAEILHDDLQQQLAAAKFHLSLLSNRAKNDPTQQMMIGQVDRMLMDAIQKSRSLSHELSPAVLYQSGLADALHWLAEQIRTRHGLDVAVDAFGEVSVASDALKTFLYRTAQELLFNVVKHARIDKARIRIRGFEHCLCLSVSDRGRGFDPQELRETTGFGLLSIRERVELLGGRMKIRSAPGRGATFHIVLPDGQEKSLLHREETDGTTLQSPMVAPTAPLQDSLAARHQQPRLRVLVADDHEIVREGLASLLQEEAGIEIVGQAANGREAVDLTDRLRPDVVIMDVAMPLINGDEATRQIKAHLPATRVVALSMHDQTDLAERMYRAGAESYILKTAPAEELLAAIRGPRAARTL